MSKGHSSNDEIDIVLPWVDPTDEIWESEHKRIAIEEGIQLSDDSESRYRDPGLLKYVFRSIEKNLPWIRKVHFITYGHLPSWLDTNHPKLNIVRHKDYIPAEYLPTYSSHTIELNMHRIQDLADKFVYFNDDIIVLKPMKKEEFFKNGLPCDYAIMYPLISDHRYSAMDIALTDIEVINDHYKKNNVLLNNPSKWFNLKYGKYLLRSLSMLPWSRFSHLYGKHLCNSFLKSSFEDVWKEEGFLLDNTCRHKFRTKRDVNQWIIREWQLVTGHFMPISPNRGNYYSIKQDNTGMIDDIKKRNSKIICINDTNAVSINDFFAAVNSINDALNLSFPDKSHFEL